MTAAGGPGRIITFYSYKGGTGRTMLLANTAWILASNGKRVLVVDWDLEAPGLHRYLHPFLVDPELTASEGLIDFVTDYAVKAMTPDNKGTDWWLSLADISRYAMSLEYEGFPEGATLDFTPAGRQSEGYASRVNSFNWQDFYNRLGGGAFLEAVRERMRADYDYVLIDSRTGVSDTAGVCTVQLPDALVVCFTLNTQSIEGAAAVAQSVSLQRHIPVLPVPTRIEFAEKKKLDLARARAQDRFGGLLTHLAPAEREAYWGRVELIYQPFYAYEEVLATFADQPGQPNSLLAAVERLTGYLTGGEVDHLVPPALTDRQKVLARFSGQPEVSPEEVVELTRRLEAKEQEVAALSAAQQQSVAASEVKPSKRRRRRVLVGALVAVILLVGGITLLGGGDDPEPDPAATASPEFVDFGTLAPGDEDKQTVTLSAAVTGPVAVERVALDEEGSSDFAIQSDQCTGKDLGLGSEDEAQEWEPGCQVIVEFVPGRDGRPAGHRHGWLGFEGPEGTLVVELKGCKENCDEPSEA